MKFGHSPACSCRRILLSPAANVPESTARAYFQQLLSAVDYLHAHGVTHNDIKPGGAGNYAFKGGNGHNEIRLADLSRT